MVGRIVIAVSAFLMLNGCTKMKPVEFKDQSPVLLIEDYFQGSTKAWGIFEDRFGTLRRQFVVEITGTWDGTVLQLDERFQYSDGETDRRVWRIRKTDDHTYEGEADDVIGKAKGEAYGNALNWRYDMDLKVGDGTVRVQFDDWMFLQPSNVLINRAKVSKFGIEVGSVTLAFIKPEKALHMSGEVLNEWLTVHESARGAIQ